MSSTGDPTPKDIIEITLREQNSYGEFICVRCRNYGGGLNCRKNVFIMAEGCNMFNCTYFEKKEEKLTDWRI